MKFVLGVLIGLAIGFTAATMLVGRRQDGDDLPWAGDDSAPSSMPQQDGMAGVPAT